MATKEKNTNTELEVEEIVSRSEQFQLKINSKDHLRNYSYRTRCWSCFRN